VSQIFAELLAKKLKPLKVRASLCLLPGGKAGNPPPESPSSKPDLKLVKEPAPMLESMCVGLRTYWKALQDGKKLIKKEKGFLLDKTAK
jgi:hypothetical protein